MIFGGRATFYILFVCILCTSFFNAFSANHSEKTLKNREEYIPVLLDFATHQITDTTYYKKVLDSTSNGHLKLAALDSLIYKTDLVVTEASISYSEKYIRLALDLKKYDAAVRKLVYYLSMVDYTLDNPERGYQFIHSITLPLDKVKDPALVLEFLYKKGNILHHSGHFKEALTAYTNTYESNHIGDSLTRVDALHQRGLVYSDLGEYNKALADIILAQQYFRRIKNYDYLFYTQGSLNVLYGQFGLEEKSIEEMKKVVAERLALGYTKNLCYDYFALSISYNDIADAENTKKYALLALETALQEVKTNPDIPLNEFLSNVAAMYTDRGELKRAKEYLDLSEKELLKRGVNISNDYYHQSTLANYYLKVGRLKASEEIALSLIDEVKKRPQEYKTDIYQLLYAIYDAKKKHQRSLYYFKKYTQLRDSVFSARKANSLSYYQTLYETEKKEKEIASQELDLQSQRNVISTQERQQHYFMIGLIALAVILIGSFFFIKKIRMEKRKVADSLIEKELLLKEIHHRVKNNLQIVYGLMYKQARISKDHTFKSLMDDAQGRIKSMAMIHQKLYQNNNFSEVDMKGYISELVKDINSSFSTTHAKVDVTLQMAVTRFHMDVAIPLGLILNELITNIYKHAFNDGTGNAWVSIEKVKDHHLVTVRDNGIGLPEDLNLKKSSSLGMNLILGLCHQIRATFDYKNNNGSEFTILLHANA